MYSVTDRVFLIAAIYIARLHGATGTGTLKGFAPSTTASTVGDGGNPRGSTKLDD